MSRILFTHSYYYRYDPKQWKAAKPYPPYGTMYAASWMRENGHEVKLFDNGLIQNPEEILPLMGSFKPEFLVIYDDGFNYLTKMCLTNMREAAFKMTALAKERGIKVIVNSSDSTDHFEKYLNAGADYVILGEGEETLKELVDELQNASGNPEALLGIAYKDQAGKVIRNANRPVIRNLDMLPQPAWDLVDIRPYQKIWKENHGYFSLNIATTRGCPYKCNWCAKPIYGNRYNSRSPERVVEEIEYLVKNHKPDHFWMCDDIFGLKPGWVQEFSRLLKEKELKIKYMIQSRADLLLKDDTIDALAESGLDTVWIGAESGSQKILDAMDKGTTIEQIRTARELLKSKGIKVAFFLQFGYLGETLEDIQATIDMMLDLMPDDIGVSVSYPLPGTKFYEIVKEDLKDKSNWKDSDELALMFRNLHSPEFYKRLHRYVHKEFRKAQNVAKLKQSVKTPWKIPAIAESSLRSLYYWRGSRTEKRELDKLKGK